MGFGCLEPFTWSFFSIIEDMKVIRWQNWFKIQFFAKNPFLKKKSFHDTLNFSIRFIPFDPYWIFLSFCNKFALSWNYRARQSCRMNNNKQYMQQMMSTLAIYTYSSSHKRNSSCCSCFFFLIIYYSFIWLFAHYVCVYLTANKTDVVRTAENWLGGESLKLHSKVMWHSIVNAMIKWLFMNITLKWMEWIVDGKCFSIAIASGNDSICCRYCGC